MVVKPQIGLLGGSFDPVHKAHIALAQAAIQTLSLDRVEMLPAGHPWQKQSLSAAPHHRLAMLKLACDDNPLLAINPIELERRGATYTIDTLAALPDTAEYTWILGTDQLVNFCTWHRWQDIVQCVRLAVAQRPGTNLSIPAALSQELAPDGLVQIPFRPMDVSASAIRLALAQGETHIPALDARVQHYIHTHRLYQAAHVSSG